MARRDQVVMLEDVQLRFRNFTGKADKYNHAGDRNFCVLLNPEMAQTMANDGIGWNIKELKAREEDDRPQPYIQVAVSYKVRPPRIIMITSKGRTVVTEDMVEMLDWVDIETVDVTLNPYNYTVGDSSGIKAYLQTMYITIHEDPLDIKYAEELPDE